ncbi:MAG: hypothetical protein ACR2L2_04405 [Acidobacteriota bacterium]
MPKLLTVVAFACAVTGLVLCVRDAYAQTVSEGPRYFLFYCAVVLSWWQWRQPSLPPRLLGVGDWAPFLAIQTVLIAAVYITAPAVLQEFCREAGPIETSSVLCFGLGALACWRSARIVAIAMLWLLLEEIDYFGIFGAWLGRTDGVYTGALHDLLALWRVRPGVTLLILAAVLLVLGLVTWIGRRPLARSIDRLLRLPRFRLVVVWASLGVAFLLAGSWQELSSTTTAAGAQFPEEYLELLGAECFLVVALQASGFRFQARGS